LELSFGGDFVQVMRSSMAGGLYGHLIAASMWLSRTAPRRRPSLLAVSALRRQSASSSCASPGRQIRASLTTGSAKHQHSRAAPLISPAHHCLHCSRIPVFTERLATLSYPSDALRALLPLIGCVSQLEPSSHTLCRFAPFPPPSDDRPFSPQLQQLERFDFTSRDSLRATAISISLSCYFLPLHCPASGHCAQLPSRAPHQRLTASRASLLPIT